MTLKPRYYYPDDVVVSTDADGKRVAKLGFSVSITENSVTFTSEMPTLFVSGDFDKLKDTYEDLWLKARELHRYVVVEEFLSSYPSVTRDRRSQREFINQTGNPSISAWRRWQADQ